LVCNGDGSSCKTVVDIAIAPPTSGAQTPVTQANYDSASTTQRQAFDTPFKADMKTMCQVRTVELIDVESVTVSSTRRRLLASQARRLSTSMKTKFSVSPDSTRPAAIVNQDSITENLANAVTQSSSAYKPLTQPVVASTGLCGNGVCEVGELCDGTNAATCCNDDCPIEWKQCPVPSGSSYSCGGQGKCIAATGKCECFDRGHTGDACSECDQGFTAGPIVDGKVTCDQIVQRIAPVATQTTTAVDDDDDVDWGLSAGMLVVIVLVTVVIAKFRNTIFTFFGCIKRPRETFVKTAELTQI
jgi:hypothetical protein